MTYELACQRRYVGETSQSAYVREREHLKAPQRREDGSIMWKHCCERHGGNIVQFVMNVTGRCDAEAGHGVRNDW